MNMDDPIKSFQRMESIIRGGGRGTVTRVRMPDVQRLICWYRNELDDSAYEHVYQTNAFKEQGFDIVDDEGKVLHHVQPGEQWTSEALDKIRPVSQLAPFGDGSETKVDSNVRHAYEVLPKNIKLSTDVFEVDSKHEARLYKLQIYPEGGHFESHMDTLHGENHWGTAVIGVSSGYEGGELEIDDDPVCLQDNTGVMFPTDTSHKVIPVRKGIRAVLQFDMYFTSVLEPLSKRQKLDPFQAMNDAIRHELVSHNNAWIGIVCQHMYALGVANHSEWLKFDDAALYRYLASSFDVSMCGMLISVTEPYDERKQLTRIGLIHPESFDTTTDRWKTVMNDHVVRLLWPPAEYSDCSRLLESPSIGYTGNESQSGKYMYHRICMLVRLSDEEAAKVELQHENDEDSDAVFGKSPKLED